MTLYLFRHLTVLFSILFFILINSQPTLASNIDYTELSLEELMQVPVTGSTLRNETLKTVPSAVTVFTHNQIEKMGIIAKWTLTSEAREYKESLSIDNAIKNNTLNIDDWAKRAADNLPTEAEQEQEEQAEEEPQS